MFLDATVLKRLIFNRHTRLLPLLKATFCLISKHSSVNKLSIGVLFQNTSMQWLSLMFRIVYIDRATSSWRLYSVIAARCKLKRHQHDTPILQWHSLQSYGFTKLLSGRVFRGVSTDM